MKGSLTSIIKLTSQRRIHRWSISPHPRVQSLDLLPSDRNKNKRKKSYHDLGWSTCMTNAGSSYIIMFIILVQHGAQLAHFLAHVSIHLFTLWKTFKDKVTRSLSWILCLFDFFLWMRQNTTVCSHGWICTGLAHNVTGVSYKKTDFWCHGSAIIDVS